MRLRDFFELSPMTRREFADKVGTDLSTVYRWVNGNNRPNFEMVKKVQDVTDGAVRFDDWLNGEK